MHLLQRQEHAEKCIERACVDGCGFRRLHDWLDEPLLPWHVRQRQRRQERLDALMRGEIPA